MCAKTGRYVFAPNVTFQISFLGHTYHKAFGGEVCPDPVNETPLVSKTVKFPGGSPEIAVNTNCTPHLTPGRPGRACQRFPAAGLMGGAGRPLRGRPAPPRSPGQPWTRASTGNPVLTEYIRTSAGSRRPGPGGR